MFDKTAMLLPTVLERPTPGCNNGEGRWCTPTRSETSCCLDTALQVVVYLYRALGSDVDTITQADLLLVIELLMVVGVDKMTSAARTTPFTRLT